ncbi:MAG: response regulator [Lachnospiraceae bacterium]|nr:response regulator [Lachnospiraceae bacterium]
MIKVFLCEDEFVVREGIKNNIDWAANGFEFAGEASDGELALPLIRKTQPDIVITDIKMPFMDGLELSRIIKKEMPFSEIVILSGYEEFEYAKQAISIGVAEYLTKPISGDDLLAKLNTLRDKINAGKEQRTMKERFKKEMEENDRRDKSELFNYLVSGTATVKELLDRSEKLGMNLSAMWYNIILLFMKSDHHEIEEYSKSSVTIDERIDAIVSDMGCVSFDRDLEGKAILLLSDSKENLDACQETLTERFRNVFKDYAHVRYCGGIGKSVNRLSQLNESFDEAGRALANRFFVSENGFYNSHRLSGNTPRTDTKLDISSIDVERIDKNNVLNFLKLGSVDEIDIYIEEFMKSVGADAFNSYIFRQYIAMDVYFAVSVFMKDLPGSRDHEPIEEVSGDSIVGIDSFKQYVSGIIRTAIGYRDSISLNRHKEIVDEVLKHMEDHYEDSELSLNHLASLVNVSPNHLSTIFSAQTGRSFIKYLTELRMNKAKELLRCTSKRSSEISEAVGYKDPHYFSYMFKKTVGMTPTNYREGTDEEILS